MSAGVCTLYMYRLTRKELSGSVSLGGCEWQFLICDFIMFHACRTDSNKWLRLFQHHDGLALELSVQPLVVPRG
jgi:hypothetical protein